jgi:hypothetical protein
MACNCGYAEGKQAAIEQHFGRQIYNSGTLAEVDAISRVNPIYFPTNPFSVDWELGFNGYRYALAMPNVPPEFFRGGYQGVLPLSQQPKIDMPQPYTVPLYR